MTLGRTLNVKKTWNGFTKKCSLNHHACSAYIHVRTLRYAGGRDVHIPAQLNKPKQEGLHTCTNKANLLTEAETVVYLNQIDQNTSRDDHTLTLHCAQPLLI